MELIRAVPALRALAELGRTGSFSAAAQRLGVSQSAVSQHVASLERQVGVPLVLRDTRPVELTRAGLVLAEHGAAVVARLEAAAGDVEELSGAFHRRLRLGGFPTALATVLPRAIALLRQRRPEVILDVVDAHAQTLPARLLARELDVAVVFEDAADPALTALGELELTPLFLDTYRLLVPRGHRLTKAGREPTLADLADETWVGGGPGSTWFQIVRRCCVASGFEPRVGLTSDDYLAVQSFVAAGLGVAVAPGLVATRRIAGVEALTLRGDRPERSVLAARPAGPMAPEAATTMVGLLLEVTASRR